jgi:hypothetical protein
MIDPITPIKSQQVPINPKKLEDYPQPRLLTFGQALQEFLLRFQHALLLLLQRLWQDGTSGAWYQSIEGKIYR